MNRIWLEGLLLDNDIPCIGRCLYIACPNKGSSLADKVHKFFPLVLKVLKSLNELRTDSLKIPPPKNIPYPEIGVIAGNKSNLALGVFLSKENDGRVEVDSTKIVGMTDFTIQPYGHKEIHYQPDIARLVDEFLATGRFN